MSLPTIQQILDGEATPTTQNTRAILIGLLEVKAALGGGGGGTQRTASISTVTAGGTVAAGKRYVEFIFSEDFAGTIDGETFDGATDSVYGLPQLSGGDTYAAIAYTITAGSARLTTF